MDRLIERIEGYGFECEAGPIQNCFEWRKIKKAVADKRYIEVDCMTIGRYRIGKIMDGVVWIEDDEGGGMAFDALIFETAMDLLSQAERPY